MVIILIKRLKKKLSSIEWTLFITYTCIGFLPLIFFSTMVFDTMDKYFVEERKKELLSQANVISGHISISDYMFDINKQTEFLEDIKQTSAEGGFRIIVTDARGIVVIDSNKTEAGKTYLIPEVIGALNDKDVANLQPAGNIYAAASIMGENSKRIGVVLIVGSAADIDSTISGIKTSVYALLAVLGAIILALVAVFSRFFSEPLGRILEVIKKMSAGYLDQRVEIKGSSKNEFTQLAIAYNNMADKIEQVEITRQNFVSNVSHELKTPLSSIKVLCEAILLEKEVPKETYIEFLRDINSEIDRMSMIINDLLTLVKLDQKEVPVVFKEMSLNTLIESAVNRLKPIADIKNISLTMEGLKEVIADVDEVKLTLAISNLIENGVKYTPEGGRVKVTLDKDHQNAFITVSDTGIGIAEEEQGKIFERFYRVDKMRDRETGGTGLGLSITHATILIHNGSIRVSSKENEGTTFTVRIPLNQNV